MKNPVFLALIILFLHSCEKKEQNVIILDTNEIDTITENSIETDSIVEENLTVFKDFVSDLRPKETLVLNKPYHDRVYFSEFDDQGDNPLIFVKKNNKTISLICDGNATYNFSKGEEIVINWKMDSIRYVGDPEDLNFKEFLISIQKK